MLFLKVLLSIISFGFLAARLERLLTISISHSSSTESCGETIRANPNLVTRLAPRYPLARLPILLRSPSRRRVRQSVLRGAGFAG